MKNLRRTIIYDVTGNSLNQKAVAFAILLKKVSKESSVIRGCTTNKLHTLTKLSAASVKRYMKAAKELGLIEIRETKKRQDLYIRKMVSSCFHRNVGIELFSMDSHKEIYHQLRSLIVVIAQQRIDYARSTFQRKCNPKNLEEFKKARQACKRYHWYEFVDRGISYKRLAQLIGCSIATAVKVVKDAIRRCWLYKHNNYVRYELKGINYADVFWCTFTTANHGYVVGANNYSISSAILPYLHGIY